MRSMQPSGQPIPDPSGPQVLAGISALSGVNTGLGGHYRSFASIIAALSRSVGVHAFHLGDMSAPPLDRLVELPTVQVLRVFATHGALSLGYLRLRAHARRLIPRAKSTVLISFDITSGQLMEALADELGLPHVNVKPGGPFRPWFPEFRDQIVFHEDDLAHLAERGQRRVHVIPNRIEASPSAPERAELLRRRTRPDDLVILRIGRFDRAHARSFQAASALTRTLQSKGLPARAVFIGAPQDRAIVEEVTADAPSDTLVLTEPTFTHDASDFIPAATLTVGMGRSAMESLTYGTPTAVPVEGLSHPVLVTPERFAVFLGHNFTHRVARERLGPIDDRSAADEIVAALSPCVTSVSLRAALSPLVHEHLSVANAPAKYLAVLGNLQERRRDRLGAALQVLRLDARFHRNRVRRMVRATDGAMQHVPAPRSRDS